MTTCGSIFVCVSKDGCVFQCVRVCVWQNLCKETYVALSMDGDYIQTICHDYISIIAQQVNNYMYMLQLCTARVFVCFYFLL